MNLRKGVLFVALFGVLALAACDSGDPADEPGPATVAGRYQFTEFIFEVPSTPALQPINVLDTLDLSLTHFDLSSNGNFILRYRFVQGTDYFLTGNFTVTPATVRIDGSSDDREDYGRILLDEDIILRRDREGLDDDDPDELVAEISKDINPSLFSDRYANINSVSGVLRIRLVKE